MRGLERRQNAFLATEPLECRQRVVVVDPRVFGASAVVQPCVLGTDRGVVESGGDGVRQLDVAVVVLEHVGVRALEHAGAAAGEPRGVLARA